MSYTKIINEFLNEFLNILHIKKHLFELYFS